MELAHRRGIDAVLVTETTLWRRSTQDPNRPITTGRSVLTHEQIDTGGEAQGSYHEHSDAGDDVDAAF